VNESELTDLLDVHDSLVQSCVDSTLPFEKFLALYNDFPHLYALDGHEATPEDLAVLRRSNRRIAFHFKVTSALSGLCAEADSSRGPYGEAGRFGPAVGLMRLRALVRRYPEFKAETNEAV
jgi:hypothetical protein